MRVRDALLRSAMVLLAAGVAPAPAAPAAAPMGLCMNYGHDTQNYDLSPRGVVEQDLARLKASHVTCIRAAYFGFNDVHAEALALFAAARGFHVILGGEWGALEPSQLGDYDAQAMQQARWAQANGIVQMSIGNEQEYRLHGLTPGQWAEHVIELAGRVHSVYAGTVSYETSGDFAASWAGVKFGGLDRLGLNLYGGYAFNGRALGANIAAHGVDHVYVSETGCDIAHVAACKTDAGLAAELSGDLMRLLRQFPQTAFYVFTWRAGGTDPAFWGLVNYPQALGVLGIK